MHACVHACMYVCGLSSVLCAYRLFKGVDTPSSILKQAPDFCNVYVIAKRKVAAARLASRPAPGRAQSVNSETDSTM